MSPVEKLRFEVVTEMMNIQTMRKAWPIWQPEIERLLVPNAGISAQSLRELGDKLYDIFTSTSNGSRDQSAVSSGGTAWEVLVCWYLNICLLGSNTVVVKAKRKHIPTPIYDSITVMYGGVPSNTESDLLAITFPNTAEFTEPFSGNASQLKVYLDEKVNEQFSETELTVIQCKTNWNDNAQIPMLWDMIYQSKGFKSAASVGNNGYVCSALKRFSYAFVTVPTVNPDRIKPDSISVMRVSSLSGGNYWGKPSVNSIALNVFAMINKNFDTSLTNYKGSWNASIGAAITKMIDKSDYFLVRGTRDYQADLLISSPDLATLNVNTSSA